MDKLRSHVGPHRVLVWLGRGGDAEVWAAEEALTGARIAIKLMRGDASSGRHGRLVREYQYLRMLSIDGVPRARSLGVDEEGRMYLAMDLVDGVSSSSWVERVTAEHRDPALVVARVQRGLALAAELLSEVHAAGLVHGDVKSSCFLVGANDRVSLIDFGGSRPVDARALTKDIDEAFGTPSYSSIEALKRAPPTIEADTWSFAATAFRLLTGEHPAGHGTRAALRTRWAEIKPEELTATLTKGAPTLPTQARELIVGCFAHDPQDRPTLGALAEALREGALKEAPAAEPFMRHEAPDGDGGGAALMDKITTLLTIAGEPLSPRVLARAAGTTTRRVVATLVRMGGVERADSLSWRLVAPRSAASPHAEAEAADVLAEVLADEPTRGARVRALATAGRLDEALAAAERWVTVLTAQGRLAEAVPLVRALSGHVSPRLALLQAKVEIASPELLPDLDEHLAEVAARDALAAPGLAKARWALARHFGSYHVNATPIALGVAWRAYSLGEIDAALTSADAALEEARWLRQPDAEADALLLLARIHGLRGRTKEARRLAAEAVDRWPARAAGIGEALATLAHLLAQMGASSEARRLVADRSADMPTPIDRAHLLVALAEIEHPFDHPAVVDDALVVVERIFFQARRVPALEARIATLRTRIAHEHADVARALLQQLTAQGLPLQVPALGAAVAEALATTDRAAAEAALAIAHDAATFMNDVLGRLRVATAQAMCARVWGEPNDEDEELTLTAIEAELWPGLVAFELARDVPLAAWSAARRFVSELDVADAYAIRLMPWAVAARAAESRG